MVRFLPLILLASTLVPARGLWAQDSYLAVSAGVVVPGESIELPDDRGVTVRGQVGLDFLVAGVHLQGGWTRLPTEPTSPNLGDPRRFQHFGAGARLRFGPLWIGATGARFFGDTEEGSALLPEVGVGWGALEAAADARVRGADRWWSLRATLRF